METLNLNKQIDSILDQYCEYLKKNDIRVVMPTFYPQRGELLEFMAKRGVACCILGGKDGVKLFEHVEQYGLEKDTTGMSETEEEQRSIVSKLPQKFQSGKLVIHGYEQYSWDKFIKELFPKVEIVSTTSQNNYKFFEEKTNLKAILETANLKEHIIPSEVLSVSEIIKTQNFEKIYEQIKNVKNGKVVVQKCGEGYHESGGGKSTYIVESLEQFKETINTIRSGNVKVAKFINGAESNLSFFCSSSQLTTDNRVQLCNLPSDINFYGQNATLETLSKTQKTKEDDLYSVVGKATLKCVSSDLLTSSVGNGVGNDVGYIYNDDLQAKILNIGQSLGKLMAKFGRSGLAGCDLIIDSEGKIWINEINDRQQGPTEQMSRDAEDNGILSILKLAFITSHCKFEKPNDLMLETIKQQSQAISYQYLKNTGNFYIKLNSTHDDSLGVPFKFNINLDKGLYKLTKNESGLWLLDINKLKNSDKIPPIDLSSNEIVIKIDGKIDSGANIESGKQIMRIEGKAVEGSSPFVAKDGKTILNPKWAPIIDTIYNTIAKQVEGANPKIDSYQDFNPLLQKRLFEERRGLFETRLAERAKKRVEKTFSSVDG